MLKSYAVEWAAADNIIKGVGDDKFTPDRTITVEKLIVLAYRYAQNGQVQAGEWNAEAAGAIAWCVANGVLDADAAGTDNAIRYQDAEMFYTVYNLLKQ